MSKTKKIIIWIVVAVIVLPILAFFVTECWYLPRYLSNKRELNLEKSDSGICVMSCNVRCWSPTDFGTKSWFYRAELIGYNIESVQPDVIGFQEVTWLHYGYLCDVLADYDSVITYRDDTLMSEGCPIFYRKDMFDLIDKGSFWLSETPEVMSKDWGSACYRVCSYVILKCKSDGKELVVFNTHLDHVSDEARIKGIKVVLDKIAEFGGKPSLLMGDLNAKPNSVTINSATESFLDAKVVAADTTDGATYQNWGAALTNERIDYVMVSKSGIIVTKYDIVTMKYRGVYPSDHFPIYVKLVIE